MRNRDEFNRDKINRALFEDRRTKKWLSDKMGISYVTLYKKLNDDVKFTVSELYYIGSLLKIELNLEE